jgi:exopolysaccharide biosynthesis polyprenyl glycosylphosphotransferase
MTPKAKETGSPSRASTPAPASGKPAKPARPGLVDSAEGSRQRGSQLRRLLASGDWLAMVAALCIATLATSSANIATLFWAVLFSPIWVLIVKLHGLYDHDHRRIRHSTLDELPALVSASALGTLALDGLLALTPAGALTPSTAIMVGLLVFAGSFLARAAVRFSWQRLTDVAVGLVIGPSDVAERVARRIATHPEARLRLAGFLGPASSKVEGAAGLPCLGSIEDIAQVAQEQGVERVIVAEQQEMGEVAAERLIEECKAAGLGLTFLPRHYGLLGPGIELNRLAELPVLDFRFSDPPRSTIAMKRAIDVVVSALGLILLSPPLAAISILILVDTGRPVLFRQRRAGKDGEPFTMIKFRTMDADAEQRLGELVDLAKLDQPSFKIQDDPRVTRTGRFLRRTSLDELPQLLNVLVGSMSLVGPRPEEEAIVALYDDRQRMRLGVKPGVTGPMQVYGRSDLTFEERLAMERDYLDNLSLVTDLAILMRTPGAIVRGEGAY